MVATVLFSGRITFPHVSLRTWGRCPFVVERVERLDSDTLLLVGREARTGCAARDRRHVTVHRLEPRHAAGGENVERVTVVSRAPAYRVAAFVRHVVA